MKAYEEQRDLLTGMDYKRGDTLISRRTYAYDTLGIPTTRSITREGTTRNDSFTHNDRQELTAATLGADNYAYAYDNIGNRKTAQEVSEEVTQYDANNLNQYTAIDEFVPTYDADGNQTKIQTSTGIWNVTYNALNRPVQFTSADGSTVIDCAYDYMGRRATKKVAVNGEVTLHQRYIYRGYLQIACVDLTRTEHPGLWLILWDPTQPVATRPLAIQKDGAWYTYGRDLTKNICEVFGPAGYIRTTYDYTPFGTVTAEGDVTQPIQWSSEFSDEELGLIYYNYRHYNPKDGRWINRDLIGESSGWNLYGGYNSPIINNDILGTILYNDKYEAFAVASKLVVEEMELRYEKDKLKWNQALPKEKAFKSPPNKMEHGVRICLKECKYYIGKIGTSGNKYTLSPLNVPQCEGGPEMVIAFVHSHPEKDASLSDADIKIARNGFGMKTQSVLKMPPKIIMIAAVRDASGKIRAHLFDPIKGKTTIYINGVKK